MGQVHAGWVLSGGAAVGEGNGRVWSREWEGRVQGLWLRSRAGAQDRGPTAGAVDQARGAMWMEPRGRSRKTAD